MCHGVIPDLTLRKNRNIILGPRIPKVFGSEKMESLDENKYLLF